VTASGCDCFGAKDAACAAEDVSPDAHENRPGLATLNYRRGTWGSILRRLRARLESPLQGSAETRDARDLNTSATDDPAVALLDAFSVVGDVLTFYQERIAVEGFMRTASERRSVGHLAGAIGYRPSPGVAAAVDLVFSVDESDKAPRVATVPGGMQVLHIPGEGQIPQPFETDAELLARAEWNQRMVPTTRSQVLFDDNSETKHIDLLGTTTGLRPNSRLLVVYGELENGRAKAWRLHRLQSVNVDSKRGITRVSWDGQRSLGPSPSASAPASVYALRTTTALFGWNAPDWHTLPEAIQKTYLADGEVDAADWPLFNVLPSLAATAADGSFVTDQDPVIDLAQEHPEIQPDSLVVIADASGTRLDPATQLPLAELYAVTDSVRVWRQNFRITGHATRLFPSHAHGLDRFGLRESVVYAVSEALALAPVDDSSLVGPTDIEVVGEVDFPPGRRLLVSGLPEGAGPQDPELVQRVVVRACSYDDSRGSTRIQFVPGQGLSQAVQRAGTLVFGNVVGASHGKSVGEVLGSGDGSVPFPALHLKQRPVTHLSDPTSPEGAVSTLRVRVNGVEWAQVGSLLGQSARAQVFTATTDDDAITTVTFGDGRTGSRLPSGVENVRASYRIGIGREGEVAAGSIALMPKKPLGMKAVTNLTPSSGAEDRETAETTRAQAPASVLVLERVVSVSDYADFARRFPGVGKASVSVLWDGDRQVVYLTVTDTSGNAFDKRAPVFENLRSALSRWGDAEAPLIVATLDGRDAEPPGPRRFGVAARLSINLAHGREAVETAARAQLESRFGAAARDLGQHVSASELIAALVEVAGVDAVDLDELYLVPRSDHDGEQPVNCVPAFPARVERDASLGRVLRPAELLLIDADHIAFSEMLP
jgi:predicted phage baseplate assembly protein